MTEIIIGADLVPTVSNDEYFNDGDIEHLLGVGLREILTRSDCILMNLEAPLTDVSDPVDKCGPCLIASTHTINGIKKINPFFYTLANNHIMDQDIQGLQTTIKCLEENQIAYAGAGNNLQEARQPWIADIKGLRVGVYCCAEHEFSIAKDNKPGANPFDPLYSFDHVSNLKKETDFVIVLYHGGKEHYRYPSPELRRIFRKFAEVGADYVIAQHTHCIGCFEKYLESHLVYGQGNFLFDHSESAYWQSSVLLKILLDKDGHHDMELIPCVKKGETVRIADQKEAQRILDEISVRNKEIQQKDFVEEKYAEYAASMRKNYYNRLMGRLGESIIVKALNKITHYKFQDWIYSKRFLPRLENCFACESHRELITTITQLH